MQIYLAYRKYNVKNKVGERLVKVIEYISEMRLNLRGCTSLFKMLNY
jgi:hypothetical protein